MFQEENKCLVLAGAFSNSEIVRQLSNEHVIDLPDLFCSHEEADTRILLHVIHSDKIFQLLNIWGRIKVKCSDTDVHVLCVHYFKVLVSTEQMWFLTGSANSLRDCRRYIPIHELSKSLSPLLANILPTVHALTGCDTTSAIFGFGKKTVLKLIRKCRVSVQISKTLTRLIFPHRCQQPESLFQACMTSKTNSLHHMLT
ncbi:Hypothetical predicted protein [Mytilus galloprovincialis]|uniref:Uncharacterized protein n=1 Tax=Mytilus galloprovincialis TaxID=29158 RepID=A0A8B6E087_MYTGA|nr:Hypothetical predicted protein [Mytilus galloprovincialis]